MLDYALAVGHHFLIFLLFGILAGELVLVRPGLRPSELPAMSELHDSAGAMLG